MFHISVTAIALFSKKLALYFKNVAINLFFQIANLEKIDNFYTEKTERLKKLKQMQNNLCVVF